ncbi:MAG: transposase [Betaproteobacteria bacterium]|nr:transposase [Betaproteobacteria bacterium]
MAQRVKHPPLEAAFAALLNNGLDGAGEAPRIPVNGAGRTGRNHFLDARYGRVREGGQLADRAVPVAAGITQSGHRRVLGVSVALSEAEVRWRAFPDSLIRRGLEGVKTIISDDRAGLKAARRATLPGALRQRCPFHLQQNAQPYVTRPDQRKPVAQRIRAIFNAPDKTGAERLLRQATDSWRTEAPKLAQWAEENLPEGFATFQLPIARRVSAIALGQHIRTG